MTQAILTVLLIVTFTTFLILAIGLLPNAQPLPTEITDSLITFVDFINLIDFIIPVGTLFTIVGLSLFFQFAMFTWKTVLFIIHLVRGN